MDSDPTKKFTCSFSWLSTSELLVGWGDSVCMLGIRNRNAMDVASGLGLRHVQVLHQFKTEFVVMGLAPLDDTLVLLGLQLDNDNNKYSPYAHL
jgi:hypothetical protein